MPTSQLFCSKELQTQHGKRTRPEESSHEQAHAKSRKSFLNQAPTLLGQTSLFQVGGLTSLNVKSETQRPQSNPFQNYANATGATLRGISASNPFLTSTQKTSDFVVNSKISSSQTSFQQPKSNLFKPPVSELRQKFQQNKTNLKSAQRIKSLNISKIAAPFGLLAPQQDNQFTLTKLRWKVKLQSHSKITCPFTNNVGEHEGATSTISGNTLLGHPDLYDQDKAEKSKSKHEAQPDVDSSLVQSSSNGDFDNKIDSDPTEDEEQAQYPCCHMPQSTHAQSATEASYDLSSVPTTSCSVRFGCPSNEHDNRQANRRRMSTLKDIDLYDDCCKLRISDSHLYSKPLLAKESQMLLSSMSPLKSLLDIDYAGYGHFWYIYQRQREHLFQPWQLTLSGKIEKLRLSVTAMYWESMKYHPISLPTVYVAIGNFNRLLNSWTPAELEHPTPAQWALTAVIAYRLAFKLEERPEILWEINNFWDLFPMFTEWSIDRSVASMNKVEMTALNILNDEMDFPLAPMFLSLYLATGGWPEAITKQYYDLAMYILGVVTFASIKDHLLRNVVPSTIAIASLILAIKIVNGDRTSPAGILSHLSECPRSSPTSYTKLTDCICRYEFFPERLRLYCNMQLTEILPVIRGLSNLLRSKPEEAYALKYSFPVWGEHDWR